MDCQEFGTSNDASAKFCSSCGSALPHAAKNPPPWPMEIDTASRPDAFYEAIVGPKNRDYYLRHFARFDGDGKTAASWHWPALFLTFYWLLYRKMWLNAALYLLFPYLALIPLSIAHAALGNSAGPVVGTMYLLYFVVIIALPPMYANAIYYKYCKRKIAKEKSSPRDLPGQLGELSKKGGTSNGALIFIVILLFFSGVLAAIAIPAYQDFTTRARLAEAVAAGRTVADSVADYHRQHRAMPASLEQAGYSAPLPRAVKEINIDGANGAITVTMAHAPISGQSFLLLPSLDSNQQIIWTCVSQEIRDRYLPRQCRRKNG